MNNKELLSCLIFCLFVQFSNAQQFVLSQEESNINHLFYQVNFMGGGIAFVDIDNDGDDDAYLVGGSGNDRLFVNDGSGVFDEITQSAGISISEDYYTTGVNYADVDNDGDEDIYINTYYTNSDVNQFSRNLLFLNNGDLTFTEIWNEGESKDESMTMGSTFIDYDLDGDLDIYNVNYVETVKFTYDDDGAINGFDHDCFTNYLYRNDGNGQFTDVTQSIGLGDTGCALAVTASDFDNDGDIDLIVGNDFGPFIEPNKFYRNDYNESGKFTEVGSLIGGDQEMFSMGIAIGDYDNDLDLDYYISNLGKNVFLEQEDQQFTDVAQHTGVENEFSGINDGLSVSWGNLFADVDNDMDLDLFVSNGYINTPDFVNNTLLDPDRLFINNGNKTFTEVDSSAGIQNKLVSRGCAFSDIDMDGKLDILSIVYNKPNLGFDAATCLFKNSTDNNNNWVKFKLEGTMTNKNAFGAKIYVYTGDEIRMAELNGGASFCSQSTSYVHFGIGTYEVVDSVKIIWPGGKNIQIEKSIQTKTVNYISESTSTGIAELHQDFFNISPNPSNGLFNITANNEAKFKKATVYDLNGKNLFSTSSKIIDLANYSSGTYIIKIISTDSNVITKRVTKL